MMKTILVPTDFSDTSLHAGRYALDLAKKIKAAKVILYHTYSVPAPVNYGIIPAEPVLLNEELIDFESLLSVAEDGLKRLENELKPYCPSDVKIELLAKYGFLTEDIKSTQKEVGADIIVMSITGGGIFTENIIGSDALIVARQASVPVIILPPKGLYKSINQILLVSDFEDVQASVPTGHIKSVLTATGASLKILHLLKDNSQAYVESSEERFLFEELFQGFDLKFHFAYALNFTDGINSFADENEMDLVVIIPKKHSLLESIFVRSHTKELAFHSHIPVMVVHS